MGARAVPVYGISEAGVVAAGCDKGHEASDCCHTFKDTVAIIGQKRSVPLCDAEVNSLLFTSLLYESPKILLNVSMGDYGVLGTEPCDCGFGRLGFDQTVSEIRSYEKLTGEGVTFVDTDFIQIIEHTLPEKFGGHSTDYQLIEEDDDNGITHLNLLVNPSVGKIDEEAVARTFVGCLKNAANDRSWAQSGSAMWSQAGTLRVKRQPPIPTKRAKILPFHIQKASDRHAQVKDPNVY